MIRTAEVNVGEMFGSLTVISKVFKCHGYSITVRCQCGTVETVPESLLLSGKKTRCKACHQVWLHDRSHLMKDRTGVRYGKLIALHPDEDRNNRKNSCSFYWICKCDCGNVVSVRGGALAQKKTTSCGCISRGLQLNKRRFQDPKVASWKYIYRNYTKSADERSLHFHLTMEQLIALCSSNCYYCGSPPSTEYKIKHKRLSGDRLRLSAIVYNGIDRLDNNKGYEQGNVVPCCKTCNYAKLKMSLTDFRAWVRRVYEHLFRGDDE